MGALLAAIFANLGNILPLITGAIQVVEALSAQSAAAGVKIPSTDKLNAAVAIAQQAVSLQAPVNAQVAEVHAAIQGQDPAAVGKALGHTVELVLSGMKAFGLFSKAVIVQNAAPLPPSDASSG